MTGLRVIAGGLQTTVQDFGRPHVQHLGIPASGAMDRTALRLANRLVGNDEAVAALEIRVLGPTLEVTADSARVALTGSRTPLEIVGEGTVAGHRSVCLTRGQRLRIPALGDGALAYLAVEGGFDLPPVYDSLATFGRAGLGGLAGRALAEGDDLPLARASVESRVEHALAKPDYLDKSGPIRVVLGPQDDFFTVESLARFWASDFTVSSAVDRMGMRLDGPAFDHRGGHDIVSDGIALGAIQVPGNGQPIILLADHQTTGGYPKVGTVIGADIGRLSRLRPGAELTFEEVSVTESEAAARTAEGEVQALFRRIAPAGAALDLARLADSNLISGVVSATPGDDGLSSAPLGR